MNKRKAFGIPYINKQDLLLTNCVRVEIECRSRMDTEIFALSSHLGKAKTSGYGGDY